MVSCSRDLEICRNIAESSSTVNLWSSRSAFSIFFSQFRQSSFPLIIMHRCTTVFKLITPLEHTCTIHSFITKCSFYLIINLNWSFCLLNEIMDDIAYFVLGRRLDWHFSWNLLLHRQFSMYWPRTSLVAEGRNQATWQCSQHVQKKSLRQWKPQYTYFLNMPRIITNLQLDYIQLPGEPNSQLDYCNSFLDRT